MGQPELKLVRESDTWKDFVLDVGDVTIADLTLWSRTKRARATPKNKAIVGSTYAPWYQPTGKVYRYYHPCYISRVRRWLEALGADSSLLVDSAREFGWPDEIIFEEN